MNVFARAQTAKGFLPRSGENLSHSHFMTSNFGEIKINYLQKVYPSDKIRLSCTNFVRTIPLTTPLNADMQLYQRFYFVPFRILWSHFEDFIFGGEDGNYTATEPYIVNIPRSDSDYDDLSKWDCVFSVNSLGDDMRFPVSKKLRFNADDPIASTHVNAYPFASYQFIYKEFYRNENIQTRGSWNSSQNYDYEQQSPTSKFDDYSKDYGLWHDVNKDGAGILDDGPNYGLKLRDDAKNPHWHVSLDRKRYANWQLDYFTSLNPWQQRGDASAINVARNTEFNADTLLKILEDQNFTVAPGTFNNALTAVEIPGKVSGLRLAHVAPEISSSTVGQEQQRLDRYADGHLMFDSSSSVGVSRLNVVAGSANVRLDGFITLPDAKISISDLRLAEQLQIMRELSARGGIRANEGLQSFFHVSPTNLELDRPQYLGGFVQTINVSDIWQTSADVAGSPLGTLAGKGQSIGKNGFGSFLVKEHGLIMGLFHIMPKAMYSDGLDREWNTNSRYDWLWPQLLGLSEQPVFGKELQCIDADHDNVSYNKSVLGYQGRFNELRDRNSFVTGDFRDWTNQAGSGLYYGAWSLARHFTDDNPPRIDDEFLSGKNVQKNGAFSVDEGMSLFQVQSYFKVRAVRPVTKLARPTL